MGTLLIYYHLCIYFVFHLKGQRLNAVLLKRHFFFFTSAELSGALREHCVRHACGRPVPFMRMGFGFGCCEARHSGGMSVVRLRLMNRQFFLLKINLHK